MVIGGLGGGGAERVCVNLANCWVERLSIAFRLRSHWRRGLKCFPTASTHLENLVNRANPVNRINKMFRMDKISSVTSILRRDIRRDIARSYPGLRRAIARSKDESHRSDR